MDCIKSRIPDKLRRKISKLKIGILEITKKDVDYFYNEDFANTPFRDKVWINAFCDLITATFNPTSIIDFGCGTGDILSPFEKKGVRIFGLDGSRANMRHLKIAKQNFLLFDLRKRYSHNKKYDICFCLEVAEHIKEKSSDILISNIAKSSSSVLFTSAPPGQEGENHVNLKPAFWWIEKFGKFGFILDEKLTSFLKDGLGRIPGVQRYYVDNLLVFKK